jgi:uncharacterized protein involved in tolerance to divalent cations
MATFRQEGQLKEVTDVLLLIKTHRAWYAAPEESIPTHDPYGTSEIAEIPVGHVTKRYWQ